MGCLSQSWWEAHNWVAEAEQVDGHHGRGEHPRSLYDLESPQLQAALVLKHIIRESSIWTRTVLREF